MGQGAGSPQQPARPVAYERQTLDHPNPVARFAHRRRHALSLALAAQHTPMGATILDFGAGAGTLLEALGHRRPDLRRLAFEPFMAVRAAGIARVTDLDALPPASLATVTAFEVLEHLTDREIDALVAQVRRLLAPGGRFIVSVPVMQGLALPLKESARMLLFRRRSDYGLGELARGTLGQPVPRPAAILTSHKGFDHRALWRRLARDLAPLATRHSPVPALPWWLNSQRFGVWAPRP